MEAVRTPRFISACGRILFAVAAGILKPVVAERLGYACPFNVMKESRPGRDPAQGGEPRTIALHISPDDASTVTPRTTTNLFTVRDVNLAVLRESKCEIVLA